METDRQRKRDSARKKSGFSVYSQKAVRAKEMCLAKVKEHPKETKPTKK